MATGLSTVFVLAAAQIVSCSVRVAYLTGPDEPWQKTYNVDLMNGVFGTEGSAWDRVSYSEANDFFCSEYNVILTDASDGNWPLFAAWMDVYQSEVEHWVQSGGRLYVNALPFAGSGGALLFSKSVLLANDTAEPNLVFSSEEVLSSNEDEPAEPYRWLGFAYSHGGIVGGAQDDVIVASDTTVLVERLWRGAGVVMLSTLTPPSYHYPRNASLSFRRSILQYLKDSAAAAGGSPPSCDATEAFVGQVTSPQASGRYYTGDSIEIHVMFSFDVVAYGLPTLKLRTGSNDESRLAVYHGGNGTTTLQFLYTVAAADVSSDLAYYDTAALEGYVVDATSFTAADLTLPEPGAFGSLDANKNFIVNIASPTTAGATTYALPGTTGSAITVVGFSATTSAPTGFPGLVSTGSTGTSSTGTTGTVYPVSSTGSTSTGTTSTGTTSTGTTGTSSTGTTGTLYPASSTGSTSTGTTSTGSTAGVQQATSSSGTTSSGSTSTGTTSTGTTGTVYPVSSTGSTSTGTTSTGTTSTGTTGTTSTGSTGTVYPVSSTGTTSTGTTGTMHPGTSSGTTSTGTTGTTSTGTTGTLYPASSTGSTSTGSTGTVSPASSTGSTSTGTTLTGTTGAAPTSGTSSTGTTGTVYPASSTGSTSTGTTSSGTTSTGTTGTTSTGSTGTLYPPSSTGSTSSGTSSSGTTSTGTSGTVHPASSTGSTSTGTTSSGTTSTGTSGTIHPASSTGSTSTGTTSSGTTSTGTSGTIHPVGSTGSTSTGTTSSGTTSTGSTGTLYPVSTTGSTSTGTTSSGTTSTGTTGTMYPVSSTGSTSTGTTSSGTSSTGTTGTLHPASSTGSTSTGTTSSGTTSTGTSGTVDPVSSTGSTSTGTTSSGTTSTGTTGTVYPVSSSGSTSTGTTSSGTTSTGSSGTLFPVSSTGSTSTGAVVPAATTASSVSNTGTVGFGAPELVAFSTSVRVTFTMSTLKRAATIVSVFLEVANSTQVFQDVHQDTGSFVYTVEGLRPATTYLFRVRLVDALGVATHSPTATVQTLAASSSTGPISDPAGSNALNEDLATKTTAAEGSMTLIGIIIAAVVVAIIVIIIIVVVRRRRRSNRIAPVLISEEPLERPSSVISGAPSSAFDTVDASETASARESSVGASAAVSPRSAVHEETSRPVSAGSPDEDGSPTSTRPSSVPGSSRHSSASPSPRLQTVSVVDSADDALLMQGLSALGAMASVASSGTVLRTGSSAASTPRTARSAHASASGTGATAIETFTPRSSAKSPRDAADSPQGGVGGKTPRGPRVGSPRVGPSPRPASDADAKSAESAAAEQQSQAGTFAEPEAESSDLIVDAFALSRAEVLKQSASKQSFFALKRALEREMKAAAREAAEEAAADADEQGGSGGVTRRATAAKAKARQAKQARPATAAGQRAAARSVAMGIEDDDDADDGLSDLGRSRHGRLMAHQEELRHAAAGIIQHAWAKHRMALAMKRELAAFKIQRFVRRCWRRSGESKKSFEKMIALAKKRSAHGKQRRSRLELKSSSAASAGAASVAASETDSAGAASPLTARSGSQAQSILSTAAAARADRLQKRRNARKAKDDPTLVRMHNAAAVVLQRWWRKKMLSRKLRAGQTPAPTLSSAAKLEKLRQITSAYTTDEHKKQQEQLRTMLRSWLSTDIRPAIADLRQSKSKHAEAVQQRRDKRRSTRDVRRGGSGGVLRRADSSDSIGSDGKSVANDGSRTARSSASALPPSAQAAALLEAQMRARLILEEDDGLGGELDI